MAKGPVEIELVISGGDLDRDIAISGKDMFRAQRKLGFSAGAYISSSAPASAPTAGYRVDFYAPGSTKHLFGYLYYPGRNGQPSMIRFAGCAETASHRCWGELPGDFDAFLRAYLAGTPPALGDPWLIGPLASVVLLLALIWLVRTPSIRRRLVRLAY